MSHKLITPPAALAVSLAEAKAQVRDLSSSEDALISSYLRTAEQYCEQMTGRAIMRQTWQFTLDAFPEAFELRRTPVASITSIVYWDQEGIEQTLDPAAYTLDNANDYDSAYALPAYGGQWPSARCQVNAVALRYLSGWPDAASVPESIKDWIKLQVGTMHQNRSSEGIVQTHALGLADRLLDRYKLWSV